MEKRQPVSPLSTNNLNESPCYLVRAVKFYITLEIDQAIRIFLKSCQYMRR